MAGTKFVQVAGYSSYAFAIDTTGQLYVAGTLPSGYMGAARTGTRDFTAVLPGTTFREVTSDSGDPAAALLDTDGNLYGNGTASASLWPMTYSGSTSQPIRLPVPDGFASYTWG